MQESLAKVWSSQANILGMNGELISHRNFMHGSNLKNGAPMFTKIPNLKVFRLHVPLRDDRPNSKDLKCQPIRDYQIRCQILTQNTLREILVRRNRMSNVILLWHAYNPITVTLTPLTFLRQQLLRCVHHSKPQARRQCFNGEDFIPLKKWGVKIPAA